MKTITAAMTMWILVISGVAFSEHISETIPLQHSGFETESLDELNGTWRFKTSDPKICFQTLDSTEQHTGRTSLRVENDSTGAWSLFSAHPIQVKPNGHYLFSAWCNIESDTSDYILDLSAFGVSEDGKITGRIDRSGGQFGAGDGNGWIRIRTYIDVPENTEQIMLNVNGRKVKSVVRLDDFELLYCQPTKIDRKPVVGYAKERVKENWDRGLVAFRGRNGVYLSWRLFDDDPTNIAFDVYRTEKGQTPKKISPQPVRDTTDYLDTYPPLDSSCTWHVVPVINGAPVGTAAKPVAATSKGYVSIPIEGVSSAQKIAIADLNGDGQMDFVLKTPRTNIDPSPFSWKKGSDTYKLVAVRHDGHQLWTYDLGWGIPLGIWFSPYLVADLDGDGKAEVAVKITDGDYRDKNGRVHKGPEYLAILNGETGKLITKVDWPAREDRNHTHANRNFMCLAYLDGKTPCLVIERGTYNLMQVVTYQFQNNKLEELWHWDNMWEPANCWGQGAHTMHAFDVDADGRDELILGSIVLDDDGSILWTTGMGHPDHVYVGDLDPTRPGLELYFGMETRQAKNGICQVDPRTGEMIWGYPNPTTHIHSQGMCSDIDARYPGCETWSGDKFDKSICWMSTAKGETIPTTDYRGSNINAIWWDDSLQRRIVFDNYRRNTTEIIEHPSMRVITRYRFTDKPVLSADILGDWREELVFIDQDEMRIYATNIPAKHRFPTFLQDPSYRATLYESSMGYLQRALPSYDLQKKLDQTK